MIASTKGIFAPFLYFRVSSWYIPNKGFKILHIKPILVYITSTLAYLFTLVAEYGENNFSPLRLGVVAPGVLLLALNTMWELLANLIVGVSIKSVGLVPVIKKSEY